MYKPIIVFILLTVSTFSVFSQDNWNRYAWGTPEREGFAVLLPFVPAQINRANAEQGISATEDEKDSDAYRDSPVMPLKNDLVFNVTFQDGVGREEFENQVKKWMELVAAPGAGGQGTGTDRATRERETSLNRNTRQISLCGFGGVEFGNSNSVQQFFLINNRLYHVWAIGGNRSNPRIARFLDSFTLINPWFDWQGKRSNSAFTSSGLGVGSGIPFESTVCRDIGQGQLKRDDKNAAAVPAAAALPPTSPLRIISKPKPQYPEESKKNGFQGVVALKVVFRADGTIGSVVIVRGINPEMNESAVAAAKLIRFEPEKRGGKPITISKTVEYSFSLY